MEGCGPCNATRPEWNKIKNILDQKYKNIKNIVIADIDQEEISKIQNLKNIPSGFPTMMYISKRGNYLENYENSNISNKNRTIDSFIEWIDNKLKMNSFIKSKKRKNKQYGARKWSLKYKRTINCKRPKGFSQKQYCNKHK